MIGSSFQFLPSFSNNATSANFCILLLIFLYYFAQALAPLIMCLNVYNLIGQTLAITRIRICGKAWQNLAPRLDLIGVVDSVTGVCLQDD